MTTSELSDGSVGEVGRTSTAVSGFSTPRARTPYAWPMLAASVVLVALWGARAATAGTEWPEWVGVVLVALVFALLPGLPVAVLAGVPGRLHAAVLVITSSVATHLLVGEVLFLWAGGSVTAGVAAVCALTLVVGVAAVVTGACRGDDSGHERSGWEGRIAPRLVASVACALAIGLVVVGCGRVDLSELGVFGVAGLLRWEHLTALVLVALVIGPGLAARRFDPVVVALGLGTLVFSVAMFLPLVGGTPAFPTVFVHRGIVEILKAHEGLVGGVDARFSWAGLFGAMAYLSSSAGLRDIGPLMAPAPLFVDVLLAPVLLLSARRLGGSIRLAWTALFLYVATNWYQQDYLAPQAAALVLYLGILSLLLERPEADRRTQGWAGALARAVTRRPEGPTGSHRRADVGHPGAPLRRPVLVDVVVFVAAVAMVVSHQITPMILICALVVLALLGRLRNPLLPLVVLVAFTVWFSFGAEDFWHGHLSSIVGDVGQVGGSVSSGVTDRLGADPAYSRSQFVRIALSGGLYVLAAVGALRYLRRPLTVTFAALSLTPFLLVAMQSYGGEGVIRCFLLGSPFAVALAALAVRDLARYAVEAGSRRVAAAVAAGMVLTLSLVLVFCRGLNASFEHTPKDQVDLTAQLLSGAPDGSKLLAIGSSALLFNERTVDAVEVDSPDLAECQADVLLCIEEKDADYVYVPYQTLAGARWTLGVDPQRFESDIRTAAAATGYRVIADSPDLIVFASAAAPDPITHKEVER